jgi:hypothetical protein
MHIRIEVEPVVLKQNHCQKVMQRHEQKQKNHLILHLWLPQLLSGRLLFVPSPPVTPAQVVISISTLEQKVKPKEEILFLEPEHVKRLYRTYYQ